MSVRKIRVPRCSKKEPLVVNWNLILWLLGLLASLKKKNLSLSVCFVLFTCFYNSFRNNDVLSRLIVTCASQWEEFFSCHLCLCLRGRVVSGLLITAEKARQRGAQSVDFPRVITQMFPEYSHREFVWLVHGLVLLHLQDWGPCSNVHLRGRVKLHFSFALFYLPKRNVHHCMWYLIFMKQIGIAF